MKYFFQFMIGFQWVPLSSTSPSVQQISSTQKGHSVPPLPSVPHQKHLSSTKKPLSSTHSSEKNCVELRGFWCGTGGCVELRGFWCETEGFLVLNWEIFGAVKVWSLCWSDVLNWGSVWSWGVLSYMLRFYDCNQISDKKSENSITFFEHSDCIIIVSFLSNRTIGPRVNNFGQCFVELGWTTLNKSLHNSIPIW